MYPRIENTIPQQVYSDLARTIAESRTLEAGLRWLGRFCPEHELVELEEAGVPGGAWLVFRLRAIDDLCLLIRTTSVGAISQTVLVFGCPSRAELRGLDYGVQPRARVFAHHRVVQ